jgi:hypothetical protein
MAADTKHPVFLQPADVNAKVWRYMDFTNYMWTLESSALYFSRIDLLGDPFEGTTTKASNDAIMKFLNWPAGSEQQQKDWAEGNAKLRRDVRRGIFVNCWHMNDHESEAMWRLYAKTDQAIALQTSYSRLVDAFDSSIIIGAIRYADYDHTVFPMGNAIWPAAHKRLSFRHENEIRALKFAMDDGNEPAGHSVPVDLANLIERVYVSPNCPAWYADLADRLTRRFGYEFTITKSRLSEEPVR